MPSASRLLPPPPARNDPRPGVEFLRSFVDSLPALLWAATADGRIEYLSDGWERYTGLTEAQLRDGGWGDCIHPDDRAAVFDRWAAATAGGGEYVVEFRYRRHDGAYEWHVARAATVRDTAGRVVRWAGVTTNVHAARAAEAALREREELLRTVLAHIPAAVFWKDRDSAYLGCNETCARNAGYEAPADLVGRTDLEFGYSKEEAEFYRACDRRVMETGEPLLNIEETQTRPTGETAVILTSKVPLRDGSGSVVGVVGVYQDVTGVKRLEEQYRQAQKMEAVGRLAAGVAHDFNNQLTVINGYSDLLLDTLSPKDPGYALVEEVRRAGERSAGLTRQLLAFGRREVVAPRVLDLNDVVRGVERILAQAVGEDVRLVTELAPGLAAVRADQGQLEQVLMNLVVNARDAMPDGGTLTVATANLPGGSRVRLTVADTGTGMTAEVRRRLFEPFFTTKPKGQGTGLGLAVVHGVVTQAGGAVEVQTAIGRGTTFHIDLPASGEPARRSTGSSVVRVVARGSETVLLAEDEDGVRALTRHILRNAGYTVLEAGDGVEAVAVAAGHAGPIHLLVTDVVMPGLGGREAAERIVAARPGTRVLYLSGYTDDAVVRHGVLRSDMAFLRKPYTPTELVYKVRDVLDRR